MAEAASNGFDNRLTVTTSKTLWKSVRHPRSCLVVAPATILWPDSPTPHEVVQSFHSLPTHVHEVAEDKEHVVRAKEASFREMGPTGQTGPAQDQVFS